MKPVQRPEFPFDTVPGPDYRPAMGAALIAAGLLALLIGLVIPSLGQFVLTSNTLIDALVQEPVATLLIAAPSVLGIFGGAWLISRGRRMRAIPAETLLKDAARPPILFLRSFDDDDLVDPTPRMIPMGDFFPRRYEESFAAALKRVGPMVAIGRPGSTLSDLGSCRLYVPDHAWKDAVNYLRARASAILFVVGRTEGLWWEIETSLRDVASERLLFFFPYAEERDRRRSIWRRYFHWAVTRIPFSKAAFVRMESERQARYQAFRKRVNPLLPCPLPNQLGKSQFLDFDEQHRPHLLDTIQPWWVPLAFYLPSTSRTVIGVTRTLRPFVTKLQRAI